MAAKKVIDFAQLATLVPKAARTEFNTLRAQYAALQNQLSSIPQEPAAIDFNFYKSAIRTNSYVDQIKAAQQSKKFTYPEDKLSATIQAEQDAMNKQVAELRSETEVKIASNEANLAKLLAEKPLEEITVEEYLSARPELRKKIQAELAQGNYN